MALPQSYRKRALTLLAGLLLIFSALLMIDHQRPAKASSNNLQIILKLLPGAKPDQILQKYNLKKKGVIAAENRFLLEVPTGADTNRLISILAKLPMVQHAEHNAILSTPIIAQGEPINFTGSIAGVVGTDDNLYRLQPIAEKYQLAQLHALTNGANVRVAVIDTGLDLLHPVFAGHLAAGYDFIDNDSMPYDDAGGTSSGHGTFVGGLIMLMAPQAELLPVRALNTKGEGTSFGVSQAIRYAADNGAQIINLSLGADTASDTMATAIDYALNKGALVVAAMGNSNCDLDSGNCQVYPATQSNVLGIGATDINDIKASFSNYGQEVSFSAVGVNLVSTYPGGFYATWSGTSFSTPLVGGECALLFSALPAGKRDAGNVRSVLFTQSSYNDLSGSNPLYVDKLGKGGIVPLSAVISAFSR